MSGLVPGRIIAEKYRLVAALGRGAMGEVWRADHVLLQTPLALKFIDADQFSGTQADAVIDRFFREARATAALRSPHVVQVLDFGQDDGVPYIAMELLEGETLEERLDRLRILPARQTAEFITHIARAIGKAHEAGIIHRDLKPGNVFILRNDDEELAKVLDFGIAKFASGEGSYRSTQTGTVVGTPLYMSPEQVQGSRTLDYRADLWSLAVIAFECVTGRAPFDGASYGALVLAICAAPMPVPSAVRAAVPAGFDAWFARATNREPAERFQSARELAESLRLVLCPDQGGPRSSLPPFASSPSASMPVIQGADTNRHSAVPSFASSGATAVTGAVIGTTGLVTAAPTVQPSLSAFSPVPTHHGVVSAIEAPARGRSGAVAISLAAGALSLVFVAVVIYLQFSGSGAGGAPNAAVSADPTASRAQAAGDDGAVVDDGTAPSTRPPGEAPEPRIDPAGAVSSPTPPPEAPGVAATPPRGATSTLSPSKSSGGSGGAAPAGGVSPRSGATSGGKSTRPGATSAGAPSQPPSTASRRLGY